VRIKAQDPTPSFGVRGWNGNDQLGWFATRNAKAWGTAYEPLYITGSISFTSSNNPTPNRIHGGVANSGTQLLYQATIFANQNWSSAASSCVVGGSISETGWFRKSGGHLSFYSDQTHTCDDEGETVLSKPVSATNPATGFVYFKSSDGHLWAHKAGTKQHF